MVEICRNKNLEVEQGDVLAYLETCPSEEFGGIFSAQVIEHLTVSQVNQWLASALRVLKPGGILIFESVNTASPYAFFNHYTRDPTHQAPLHPETYRFLAELHVTPGVRILIIREDGTVMSPRSSDQNGTAADDQDVSFIHPVTLKENLLKDALDIWQLSRTESFAVKSFSSEGKTWWPASNPCNPIGPAPGLVGSSRKRISK